jgi:hypothetical protein
MGFEMRVAIIPEAIPERDELKPSFLPSSYMAYWRMREARPER